VVLPSTIRIKLDNSIDYYSVASTEEKKFSSRYHIFKSACVA